MSRNTPFLFKPVRYDASWPMLTEDVVRRNFLCKRDTSIIFDLNIMTAIEDVIINELPLSEAGLEGLVRTLNAVPMISLCPGVAIHEVSVMYADRMRGAFNLFVNAYLPKMQDAPGAINTPVSSLKKTKFFADADSRYQAVFSYFYLSQMILLLVSRENLSPVEKFSLYLDRMGKDAGMIGTMEALVAQICFFDRSRGVSIDFNRMCARIKDNFIKGGGTPERRKANCLNQAHDMFLARFAAASDSIVIDGRTQDIWIASADEGIGALFELAYYAADDEGRWTGSTAILQPYEEMVSDAYFVKTNKLLSARLMERQFERWITNTSKDEIDLDVICKNALKVEAELDAL